MTYRIFVYISVLAVCFVCTAILAYFFFTRPFISDIKVLSEKEIDTRDFTDPTAKASHFVITVEKSILTVHINGEEQIRYTPHSSAKDTYSIGFFYPPISVKDSTHQADH